MHDFGARYATAGLATAAGMVLLGLSVFSDPATILAQLRHWQPAAVAAIGDTAEPIGETAEPIGEPDALRQEWNSLRHQVAALTSHVTQLEAGLAALQKPPGPAQRRADPAAGLAQPRPGAEAANVRTADSAMATPASVEPSMAATEMTVQATDTLRERIERIETCLVEARTKEATALLETMLFQVIFRPVSERNTQTTAPMIRQALGALAAADLDKAAFYTEQVRTRL
jgi:hypothetical protein